ncbi:MULTISPECIES: endonuclease domain-containing protein [unclassified Sphingomonas]|uniref:endonuclease domain-containing protein n=1 Tax=unclassified Sphingomonas TaxID=196159 RepID=UPI0009EC5E1D|nr:MULTISPECIES: endonuclease domain-containing protein [unclassified Sphingomonas]
MRLYQDQPSGTVTQLRALRRHATEAEKVLRRSLREAFPDTKWRFQAPVGPFRVDFLCFAAQLVIEVDGGQHAENTDADARRTRFIEAEGYRVIRFWNNDVLNNTDGVIAQISLSLRESERACAPKAGGKGEGDQAQPPATSRSPSPRAAARLAPLPMGEGMKEHRP